MSVKEMYMIPKELYTSIVAPLDDSKKRRLETINVEQLNVSCGPLFAGQKNYEVEGEKGKKRAVRVKSKNRVVSDLNRKTGGEFNTAKHSMPVGGSAIRARNTIIQSSIPQPIAASHTQKTQPSLSSTYSPNILKDKSSVSTPYSSPIKEVVHQSIAPELRAIIESPTEIGEKEGESQPEQNLALDDESDSAALEGGASKSPESTLSSERKIAEVLASQVGATLNPGRDFHLSRSDDGLSAEHSINNAITNKQLQQLNKSGNVQETISVRESVKKAPPKSVGSIVENYKNGGGPSVRPKTKTPPSNDASADPPLDLYGESLRERTKADREKLASKERALKRKRGAIIHTPVKRTPPKYR
jgi:hypothetical protein